MFSFNVPPPVVPDPGTYTIKKRILTYASRIFFIEGKQSEQRYCVKMWRPHDNRLYQTMDQHMRAMYLLEGFHFNNKHAPGVCVGIASVRLILAHGEDEDQASALALQAVLTNPQASDLEDGQEYALLMECLDDNLQLSTLLQGTLASKKGMEILGQQISLMHRHLAQDSQDLAIARQIGSVAILSEKLNLNKDLFREALKSLSLSKEEERRYNDIPYIISSAYIRYQNDFTLREEGQHIRRCHGDLKATNLWLYPVEKDMTDVLTHKVCLLALDCIDFMPKFCHIDTLSDVAMLAIDIEFYLAHVLERLGDGASGRALALHFLETYLKQVQEQEASAWRLLNYYMVEKAMIGMYGNILHDRRIEAGKQYLDLAYTHAKTLRSLL